MMNNSSVKMLEHQVCNMSFIIDSSGMLPAVLSFAVDKIEDNTFDRTFERYIKLSEMFESYMKLILIQLHGTEKNSLLGDLEDNNRFM